MAPPTRERRAHHLPDRERTARKMPAIQPAAPARCHRGTAEHTASRSDSQPANPVASDKRRHTTHRCPARFPKLCRPAVPRLRPSRAPSIRPRGALDREWPWAGAPVGTSRAATYRHRFAPRIYPAEGKWLNPRSFADHSADWGPAGTPERPPQRPLPRLSAVRRAYHALGREGPQKLRDGGGRHLASSSRTDKTTACGPFRKGALRTSP